VAAVFCFSGQAQASTLTTHVAADHATTADTLGPVGQSFAQLLASSQRTVASKTVASKTARPVTYTVRSGDTLSAIAGRVYHDEAAWPVIYWANRGQIHWANDITVGQKLRIPAKPARIPKAPGQLGPGEAAVGATQAEDLAYTPQATVSYSGDGGFTSCVIAAESGGNSQVMNASGHYGLYQFSESTWEEYGGSAADFGDATVAEQNQVFDNALAAGGESNWSAYDGC
jgi:LysM repeat protein